MDAYDAILQVEQERWDALDTDLPRKVANPLECPAEFLGHLAWSRGLDYWGTWPESVKRQLILQTQANLRIRGTRAAIDNALEAFAADLTVEEWWQQSPQGTPGTALATVALGSGLGADADAQDLVNRLIAREGRKSIDVTLALGVGGSDAIAAEARGRATMLYQHSGVQAGA